MSSTTVTTIMDEIDFDLLNEKYHPRKRMKGRKGRYKTGSKGSQKKIFRPKEVYTKYYNPKHVRKFQNEDFKETEYYCDRSEAVKREFDDGGMESNTRVKNQYYTTRFYFFGYTRKYWTYIPYSTNKKKRWELERYLDEHGGLFNNKYTNHLKDEVKKEMKEEEEKGEVFDFENERITRMLEEYDEIIRKERRGKKNRAGKKKKRKKKHQRYSKYFHDDRVNLQNMTKQQIETTVENYRKAMSDRFCGYPHQIRLQKKVRDAHNEITDRKKSKEERRMQESKRRERKRNIQNELKKEFSKSKKKKRRKGRFRRKQRTRMESKSKDEDEEESESFIEMKKKNLKDQLLRCPDFYEFENKKQSFKKWVSKQEGKNKHDYLWRKGRKRRELRSDVRDIMSLKY